MELKKNLEPDQQRSGMNWKVVRIYGQNCLKSVAELEECGAVVYCPVVRERRRIGATRRKFVEVKRPAYLGWAFMAVRPDPHLVVARPWLRFRLLEDAGVVRAEEVDRIRAEEAAWNMEDAGALDGAHAFEVGDAVKIRAGFLKGMLFDVEASGESFVKVRKLGDETSMAMKITPFLLEKVQA
jgi:hypothetical protein